MKIKAFTFILFALAASFSADAESAFYNAIQLGIQADPAIAATASRAEATVASFKAENVPDGPEVDFEHLWSTRADELNKWNVGITQEVQLPGAYRARNEAANAVKSSFGATEYLMRLDCALVIKLAIVDLINAQRRLNLQMEIRSNLDRINELTERAFQSGNATILDQRKMQLAVLDSDNTLTALRGEIEQLMSSLSSMGVKPEEFTPEMLTKYPEMTLCEANYTPLQNVAESTRTQALAEVKVARRAALPSFGLGYRHAYEDGTHFNGLSVSVKLPQWSRRQRVKVAEAEAQALEFDASARKIEFQSESDALMRQAMVNSVAIEKYAGLTSDNSYLALLQKAFDAGQLPIIDYLTEINMFAAARLNYLDLEYRQALTLTRLRRYTSIDF